ncbi:MAG: hypothetical protein CRN43_10600 [Candidatus Nephrothrix sp. EaCA]|nr:MAG: hypothetical protein CRN43_10600 [Candidatus Nephrothrix sp. EaCA]
MALKPDARHTFIVIKFPMGGRNHREEGGNSLKISNMTGAAAFRPINSGRPSPVVLPVQTNTPYAGVTPIAQPSLKPKLVPVFQAMRCDALKESHSPSSPGRITSVIARKVCHKET